jgi:hypothetical protein
MEAETAYSAGLLAVDTITLDETLTLTGANVELVFELTG